MLEVTKTVNVSGYSRIAESDAPYVYFSASISADGKRSVNYSVQNQDVFNANEKTFDQHGSGGQYGSQHNACPCFCVRGGGSNLKL